MKIAAYYIAKFRELFKNEIEKNLSTRESGFLIAKRALGRFFLINFCIFCVCEAFGCSYRIETAWYASLFGR